MRHATHHRNRTGEADAPRSCSGAALALAAAVAAGVVVAGVVAAPIPAAAAPLDGFLATFRDCDLEAGAEFSAFVQSLAKKYGNAFSRKPGRAAVQADVSLALPAGLAEAIGPVSSVNRGDHTAVAVPLKGTLGGLEVTRIDLALGNENGIYAATLVFAAPRAAVAKAFGASIAAGMRKGEAAAEDGAGYSAAIESGNPGRISCDWSN